MDIVKFLVIRLSKAKTINLNKAILWKKMDFNFLQNIFMKWFAWNFLRLKLILNDQRVQLENTNKAILMIL